MLHFLPFLALLPLFSASPEADGTPLHPRNPNHPQHHLLKKAITGDATAATSRSFDFIVAGGGLAGLAIAARLSEWSNVTVLCIEAGGDGEDVQDRINIPGYSYLNGLGGSQYDWAYSTTPQPEAFDLQKKWPRGKGLGGSGAINGMYWTRGGKEDYDAWNTLNPGGAQDWGWSEVTRCINKAENWTAPPQSRISQMGMVVDASAHGTTGAIQAGYSSYMYDVIANWIPTWVNLGFKSLDLHGGDTRGVTISPLTLNPSNQTRSDSKAGYIDPLPPRSNLVILTGYQVTGITYNGTTDANGNVIASGVSFQASSASQTYTVNANKEVILSAGTIGSPQILQLSGIGPKSVLQPLGIESKVDLSVGYNMQDHISFSMYFNTAPNTLTWNALSQNQDLRAQQLSVYQNNRTGMWTFVNAALGYPSMADLLDSQAAADDYAQTINTDFAQNLKDTISWKSFPADVAAGLEAQWKIQQSWINTGVGQVEVLLQLLGNGGNEIGIQIAQQHQWSRGSVFITSSNPFEYPNINPDYFGHGYDVDILAQGAAFARRLTQAAPLSNVLTGEKTPGATVTGDPLYDYIKRSCGTEYHPMGTCSMMPRDKGGVVDTNLIVYGTSNIRVVDCSIMPLQLSSHLMATGYGIAEKAAEIIKSKYTLLAQQQALTSSSSAGSSATGSAGGAASSAANSAGAGNAGASTSKGGLSQAATIGVGVGAGVGGALLLGALILFCCLRKRKQKQAPNEKGWYQPAARGEPGYSDQERIPKETPGDYQMANFAPPAAPYAAAHPNRISTSPSVDTMATADLPAGVRRSSSGWLDSAAGSGAATPAHYDDHYGYPTQPPSGAWNPNAQTYSRVQPR